jgi:GT2 family glycosyltransferase
VASLTHLRVSAAEVIVTDDASDRPVEPAVRAGLPADYPWPIRFVRHESPRGYILARNAMARQAAGTLLLTLDDDAELIDPGVTEGARLLADDPRVGAVGFAQVDDAGERYPDFMQPAPVRYPCYAPTYYGYAHLVRRDLFLRLGGYRERFRAYGEETEFCKRVWDATSAVVYLPAVEVKHVHSPSGRANRTRMRYGLRNAILGALYNEPFPLPLLTIPARVFNFTRWAYGIGQLADLGLGWQAKEFVRHVGPTLADRRPVRGRTHRTWNFLKANWPAYPSSAPALQWVSVP